MEELESILRDNKIYTPDQILDVLHRVRPNFRIVRYNSPVRYFNVPAAFDIETSSFMENGEKRACMYVWQFCIYGAVIMGRTWDEFITMLCRIREELELSDEKRLLIYSHNLSYEFQWLRKWLSWQHVFATSEREPLYAVSDGIEFRCSYRLSGYSLDTLAKNLQNYSIRKLTGDLRYDLIRHCETPLTQQEIAYCVNDVKIVTAYIGELIDTDGNIARIPLTKTGFVRRYIRERCFWEPDVPHKKSKKRRNYGRMIKSLTITPEEYDQLRRAFQGGFTHANAFYTDKIIKDVRSFDFTSSYPTVLCCEQFPMSSSEEIEIESPEQFHENLDLYCCLFDIEIRGLRTKLWQDHPLSISRCRSVQTPQVDNGRLVSADLLRTTITEQDYLILRTFYGWDDFRVWNFRRYKKDYLPRDFVDAILDLYAKKTELKGVDGAEREYLHAKELLNACFGMAVTGIVRPEIIYDNDHGWDHADADAAYQIERYNNGRGRFLFFPWGVWCTAHARRNLFAGILECGNDYIYSDTDSIKIRNAEKHMAFINDYNRTVTAQLQRALTALRIPTEKACPKTVKGVQKPLGVWDDDGTYKYFKTLGAKRYLTLDQSGHYKLTVAGVNKSSAMQFLLDRYGKVGAFTHFKTGLQITEDATGKLTHTYIDDEISGTVTDVYGRPGPYHEKSFIHLAGATYVMSRSQDYIDYLKGVW